MITKVQHELLLLAWLREQDKPLASQLEETASAIRKHEQQGFHVQKYYFQDDALRIEMTRNEVAAAWAESPERHLDKRIEELALTTLLYNALDKSGFRTVRDVVSKSKREISHIRNVGRKSVQELEEKLTKMGLTLGMKVENEASTASGLTIDERNLDKSIDDFDLSVRTYNCLKNGDIRTVRDLVQKKEAELLEKRIFGPKSLREIKETILGPMGFSLGMKLE